MNNKDEMKMKRDLESWWSTKGKRRSSRDHHDLHKTERERIGEAEISAAVKCLRNLTLRIFVVSAVIFAVADHVFVWCSYVYCRIYIKFCQRLQKLSSFFNIICFCFCFFPYLSSWQLWFFSFICLGQKMGKVVVVVDIFLMVLMEISNFVIFFSISNFFKNV